jgi:hypothetical protein
MGAMCNVFRDIRVEFRAVGGFVYKWPKVSILLTEKTTAFMYFIEMQIICFSYRADIMLIICFGCFG